MRRFAIIFIVLIVLVSAPAVMAQEELTLGVPFEGILEDDAQTFVINLQSANLISISLTSEDFDPQVTLTDADGGFIGTDDDGGGYPNSLLLASITVPGTYNVVVEAAYGFGSGNFVLTVSVIEPLSISYDTPVNVNLAGTDPAYMSFKGSAGDVVNIYADSGAAELNTELAILSASGEVIAEASDGGIGWEPAIVRMILPEDGPYIIKLAPSYDEEFGTVAVTVEQTELVTLDDGPITVTLGNKFEIDVLRLTTEMGSQYTVQVSGSGTTFSVDLEIGDFFDGNQASFDNVLGGSMTIPGSGDVIDIVVRNGAYNDTTTVEVSVAAE